MLRCRAPSYRANPQRFGERQEWIGAGGYEFVRNVALKVKIGDSGSDGVIVQFLGVIDFMPTRDAAGVEMSGIQLMLSPRS